MKKNAKKRKSAFVLEAYEPRYGADDRELRGSDGASVLLRRATCGVFSTVRKAERAIGRLVEAREDDARSGFAASPYFAFALVEHYVDEPFDGGAVPAGFRSFRTYLPDGSLNCASDLDAACEKKFRGSKGRRPRFAPGDMAWALEGLEAVPALVEAEAMTAEEWRARFAKGVAGDFVDDSGVDFPYGLGGHAHTFSPLLFPAGALRAKVPAAAKREMAKARRRWLKGGL